MFVALSRDALVESDPGTFLPPPADIRYQWVCARLDALDISQMRELAVGAWMMTAPQYVRQAYLDQHPQ